MRPSDKGLLSLLNDHPLWDEYVILLGLSAEQRNYLSTHILQESRRGMIALTHWRDGHCGESHPSTWRFLLDKLKSVPNVGPRGVEKLKKKVAANKEWTLTDVSCNI